jgi:hypothetical protein
MKLSPSLQKLVDAAERALHLNGHKRARKAAGRTAAFKAERHLAAQGKGYFHRKAVGRSMARQAELAFDEPKPKRTTKKRKATKKRTTKKRPIAKRGKKPARAGFPAKTKRRTAASSSRRRASTKHVMVDVVGYKVRWQSLGGRQRYGMFCHDRNGNSAGSAIVEPDRNRPDMFWWVVATEDDVVKAEGTDTSLRAAKERAHAAFMRHFRRYLK